MNRYRESRNIESVLSILILTIIITGMSCGDNDSEILATAGDITVTTDDFTDEFNSLSPQEQVEVLEPLGKHDLVTKLIYKKILHSEAESMDRTNLDNWLKITELALLSQEWHSTAMSTFNPDDIDSIFVDSLLRTRITLSSVLVQDSIIALQVRDDWIANGPGRPSTGMALAPWSINGNSYIDIQSDLFTFLTSDPVFAGYAVPYANCDVTVFPAFGVWCVLKLDTDAQFDEHIPFTIDNVASLIFEQTLAEEACVIVKSDAITGFASIVQVEEGHYRIPEEAVFEPDVQLAVYNGGFVTAGDVALLIELIQDRNFRDGVPPEYAFLAFNSSLFGVEIDLWRYVYHIGMVFSEAENARNNGLELADADRELTITDYVVREKVIAPASSIDSVTVMSFYEANAESFILPELRSVKLVYVPMELITPEMGFNSFDSLPESYSSVDSSGGLIPTVNIPKERYGPLGDAIFRAELNVFEGPVELPESDVFAFFEVVNIVPSGNSNPADIYDILYDICRTNEMNRLLNLYLTELWTDYEVKIDSAMVDDVDPWQSVY